MVQTIKLSELPAANVGDDTRTIAGIATGANVNSPYQNTWTTSTRPGTVYDGLLGYNTTTHKWEYWNVFTVAWTPLT